MTAIQLAFQRFLRRDPLNPYPTGIQAFKGGVAYERERMIALLEELGVLRGSMLGTEWRVLYTQTGAQDIRLDKLEKENE